MVVDCGHDKYQCDSANDLERVIRELLALDSAEVWISQKGEQDEYPCMALLVNERCAVLNYFGDDGSCYSSSNGSHTDGFVSFCDGQYEIHSYQVISKEAALTAVLDHYRDNGRSSAVMWDQLY